jgi:hypothetical protein
MEAITVKNSLIPFKGFMAITIWPFIFVKKKEWNWYDATAKRHEGIHFCQQMETHVISICLIFLSVILGLLPWRLILVSPLVYFSLYGLEYIVRWICYGFDTREAYRNISFEQEAFLNENDLTYIKNRHLFASWKYLFRKTYDRK